MLHAIDPATIPNQCDQNGFLTGILSGLRVLPSYLLVYATNAIFKFDVKVFSFFGMVFILFLWPRLYLI